jgi:hypothetical protein
LHQGAADALRLNRGIDRDRADACHFIGLNQEVRADHLAIEEGHHAGVVRALHHLGDDHLADGDIRDIALDAEAVVESGEGLVADAGERRDFFLGGGDEFECHASCLRGTRDSRKRG